MAKPNSEDITRYADMLAAMGTEPRLRIMRLLLSAHPGGMVVGDIGAELETSPSTLSHRSGKAEARGSGVRPKGRNLPVVFGEHERS
jgi:ArsR family transcriptional regulator, arsenate/arsenite/antimonite-responsive transcriptional repressor